MSSTHRRALTSTRAASSSSPTTCVVVGHTDRGRHVRRSHFVTALTKTLFTELKHATNEFAHGCSARVRLWPPARSSSDPGCSVATNPAAICGPVPGQLTSAARANVTRVGRRPPSCLHPVQEGDESPVALQERLDTQKNGDEVPGAAGPLVSSEVLLHRQGGLRVRVGPGFFQARQGVVSAVDRVSITVKKGENLRPVGEYR